jgi:hypothetical protein
MDGNHCAALSTSSVLVYDQLISPKANKIMNCIIDARNTELKIFEGCDAPN